MPRIHLHVEGMVQGVGYRHSAVQAARALGLTGWVKNLSDGRVELLAEGEKDLLQRLLAWCQTGSFPTHVENVEVEWSETRNEFPDFRVRW